MIFHLIGALLIVTGIFLSSKEETSMKIKEGEKLPNSKVFIIEKGT